MSADLVFRCSKDCGIRIPLALNMPVLKPDTPKNLRKLPIKKQSFPYLEGYESDEFCLHCRKVVTIFDPVSPQKRKYELDMEEWEERGLFLKLIHGLRGVKRPIMADEPNEVRICPICSQTEFIEENTPCYNCKEGVFIIDDKFRVYY